MILIPTFQSISADFEQEIDLNNQLVKLRITYNIRNNFFHLSITDSDAVNIEGMKIVPNYPLLAPHKAYLNFSGDLFIVKEDESLGDEITYDNFGSGYNLYYFTPEESEAWRVANGLE